MFQASGSAGPLPGRHQCPLQEVPDTGPDIILNQVLLISL